MLARAGNAATDLQCGTHAPGFYEARGEVPPPPPYSPLAHNCSGKHSGMLAYCVHCAARRRTSYLDVRPSAAAGDPPRGRAFHRRRRRRSSSPASTAARRRTTRCRWPASRGAFARLAARRDDAVYGSAPRRLADAMTAHPEMVSGERRNDLALMRAGRGDWVTKIGAEGVQAIGIRSRGDGHRRQGRRRVEARRSIRPSWRCSTRWGSSTPGSATELGAWRAARGPQLPRHRHRRGRAGACTGQIT